MFSFLLGMYLGMEFLGHMITLCLTFEKLPTSFLKCLCHFIFPAAIYGAFSFSTFSPILILSVLLFIAILIDVKWFHILVLICVSLVISDLRTFHVPIISLCFLEKFLFRLFACFLFGLFFSYLIGRIFYTGYKSPIVYMIYK